MAKKKKGKIKATGTRLEGFVDLVDPIASDPAKEREDDMPSLTSGFSARMCKRATNAQGETTPGFEVSGGKRSRRSGLNKEAQRSSVVIIVDSPERASNALLALEGAT